MSRLPRLHTFDSWIAYRDYRFLWIGNFCANSAQWMQLLTVGWFVQDLTAGSATSALLVISVGAINTLPGLIVGPWGGVLGDRVDRRKLVMGIQSFMVLAAFAFASLVVSDQGVAFSDQVKVWLAYVYILTSGVARSMIQPLRQALIANTVPREALGNALATNVLTITSTRLIGPFFGGVLIASLGFFWNFTIEGLLYAGMVLMFIPMRTPYFRERPLARGRSPLSDLKEGIRYIWREERVIFNLMCLGLIPNLLLQPFMFLLPVFTVEVLRQGPDVGGFLLAANGAGGLAAAFIIASVGFIFKKGKLVLFMAAGSSLTVLLMAYSQWLPAALIVIALVGFTQSAFRTTNGTLIQTLVPDNLRSRVTSLQGYGRGFIVFSSLLVGWFADVASVSVAIVVIGAAGVSLAFLGMLTLNRVRQLE